MEGRVAFETGDGVALEIGLVEKKVDDFIYEGVSSKLSGTAHVQRSAYDKTAGEGGIQFPRMAASW